MQDLIRLVFYRWDRINHETCFPKYLWEGFSENGMKEFPAEIIASYESYQRGLKDFLPWRECTKCEIVHFGEKKVYICRNLQAEELQWSCRDLTEHEL